MSTPHKPQILDSSHPKYREFLLRIMDFGMDDCDTTHKLTRKILREFENIDIRKTLRFYSERGGHCVCEIMFNVIGDDLLEELSDEKEGDEFPA